MSIIPSYLELCVKLYIGQENFIKHLPSKYVISGLPVHSVCIDCQCCYSVCKPDIDLVLDVHPVERPARAYRNTSRAKRGRCFDTHEQVFLLDEHLGQGRYPIHIHTDITCNTEEPQQKYRLGTVSNRLPGVGEGLSAEYLHDIT